MSFFRNVLGTFFTEISILVLNFATGILLARLLPPSERGVLALIMLLPVTLAYFADIGISQAIVYQLGRSRRPPEQVAANGITLAFLLGGSIALVIWLARGWLLHTMLSEVPESYFTLVLYLLPLLLVSNYLLSILRGQQRFAMFNLWRLLAPMCLLLGVIFLVGFLHWGVKGAVIAFVASNLLGLAFTVLVVGRIVPLRLGLERSLVFEAVGFGVKSYLQNLVGHMHYRLDVYLLALFLPPAQVAFYTVATSVAEFAFYIPDSVGTVLFPKLSAEADERINDLTAEVCRHTFLITGLVSTGILIVGWLAIPLFYGAAYRAAIAPFIILMPGILAMAVYKVLTRNFTSRNRQQVPVVIAVAALGLNAVLNLLLIPRLGISGAALASLLSYTALAVVLLYVFKRRTGIPLRQILVLQRSDLERYVQVWARLRSRLAHRLRWGSKPVDLMSGK
ncbi:MAG TPA: flippase [Anaerolineales bacterium]